MRLPSTIFTWSCKGSITGSSIFISVILTNTAHHLRKTRKHDVTQSKVIFVDTTQTQDNIILTNISYALKIHSKVFLATRIIKKKMKAKKPYVHKPIMLNLF